MSFREIASLVAGTVGGALSWLFGGFDALLISLFVLMGFDILTGLIKGACNEGVSSGIFKKGVFKKFIYVIIVSLAVVVQRSIITSLPVRDMIVTFFVASEALSILENASVICPNIVPNWLIKLLKQTKDEVEKGREEDEKEDIS